jgi:hypothetical protein
MPGPHKRASRRRQLRLLSARQGVKRIGGSSLDEIVRRDIGETPDPAALGEMNQAADLRIEEIGEAERCNACAPPRSGR